MAGILDDLSGDSLARAVEENTLEEFRLWSRWPSLEFHDDPERTWTIADVASPVFNNVLRARFDPAGAGDAIEGALAPFRERSVPCYWWVGRSSRPGDLGSRLLDRGLESAFTASAMAVDLGNLPEDPTVPVDLEVEEVRSSSVFSRWLSFSSPVMALPGVAGEAWSELHRSLGFAPEMPLRHFLASLGGEPVASASLFTGAGAAGLAHLVTRPDQRGRGIGTSLTLSALKSARNAGYRAGVLLSTPAAAGLYRRLGFREYGRQWCYLWGGETAQ